MTKNRLRAYRKLKEEKQQLEALMGESETEELRACYQAKVAKVEAEQLAIEEAIDSLSPTERALMRAYYIEGLTLEEVCVRINYSWRHTNRMHSQILTKLRDK